MNEKYNCHWLLDIVDKIIERNVKKVTLATGKTPSGHIHLGILRELVICDAIRQILTNKNINVEFFLFLDSLDAAKRFPDYIDKEFQELHIGKPFAYVPCPYDDCNCSSYAFHFGNELISTFKDFGIKNQIIWSHELYKTKKMQEKIEIALENTEDIKDILKKNILPTLDDKKKKEFLKSQEDWIPVMVICEKCDKIQFKDKDGTIIPNRGMHYDINKKNVRYKCPSCGHTDEISIYSGRLKLNWRVDWPAKWSIFKTTCEPAGKDHCVKGGSYDTGLEICEKIFDYGGPIKVPYEWVRLGDKDMKTSKGIVFTPKDYLKIADPEIFRMLILRTNPMKHISFRIEEIPQYYEYYNQMESIYYLNKKVESENDEDFYKFLYPLVKIGGVPEHRTPKIPINLMIFLSQIRNILDEKVLFKKVLETIEDVNLKASINFQTFVRKLEVTTNWIEEIKQLVEKSQDKSFKNKILRKISLFSIPKSVDNKFKKTLDNNQKRGIKLLRNYIIETDHIKPDDIQNKIFKIANDELNMKPKKLFQAIYLILLGKKYGPRLGPFLLNLDREWLLKRLEL